MLILNDGSENVTEPLSEPPSTLIDLLSRKSGANALSWLYFLLMKHNMYILPGMATALAKGQILSISTWKSISNLSVLFCPPRSQSITDTSNYLILQVLEQEGKGYEASDVKFATSQKPSWAKDTKSLRKQIGNFTAIYILIFGYDSYLVQQLSSWNHHIHENELC